MRSVPSLPSGTFRWFEVIAGKSVPAAGPAKCFGFVQTHDTKPKRRLFELLAAPGMQANQQVTFRTDGADDVAFELAAAVRSFPSYRGQRNWPGLSWSATMGCHVGYESWLERDHAMLLDFDGTVSAFASQPFWLRFPGEAGKERVHAPDFFAPPP